MEFYQTFLVILLVVIVYLGTLVFLWYSNRPLLEHVIPHSLHNRRTQHPADPHFVTQYGSWD